MIASFFRHLDALQVQWLLVSGQATILYGAANFSEDVDLWVEGSAENLNRLLDALRLSQASYYKLTPPLTAEFARRHHGFHFTLPSPEDASTVYLDVMCRPPRVGMFAEALQRSTTFDTQWGTLRTIGIVDLVELKKTQRPRDYPVISRLVLARLRELGEGVTAEARKWAVENTYSLAEYKRLVVDFPSIDPALPSLLAGPAEDLRADRGLNAATEDALEEYFDEKIAPLRRADRHFWRDVIEELRQLRAAGQLMPEGALV